MSHNSHFSDVSALTAFRTAQSLDAATYVCHFTTTVVHQRVVPLYQNAPTYCRHPYRARPSNRNSHFCPDFNSCRAVCTGRPLYVDVTDGNNGLTTHNDGAVVSKVATWETVKGAFRHFATTQRVGDTAGKLPNSVAASSSKSASVLFHTSYNAPSTGRSNYLHLRPTSVFGPH